jgi:hypothetical protein
VKDIASTIAALLGIAAPKDNAGKILEEVMPANRN